MRRDIRGAQMAKAVSKGSRVERKCADELRDKGYIIWKTIRVKYQNIDLFGLFDVVALHPEGKHIKFIQCKTNRADNKAREAIMKLKMPSCCEKEMWIWKDRRGWIKESYD